MSAAKLSIKRLSRETASGSSEAIEFKPGVNVLVGVPNTGKTKWLTILDYLMGEKDSALEALGEDIAEKYVSAACTLLVDGTEVLLERHWKKWGAKGTVLINEAPVPVEDFDTAFLGLLRIPVLHYPQGNPYGPRRWPRLSWRSLLRHIYRRQEFWSEIADKQPDSEQHAALMQFAGVAEALFSDQFGMLVETEKHLADLRAQRRAFATLLDEVSAEIVGASEASVAVTPASVAEAEERVAETIAGLENEREALIAEATSKAEDDAAPPASLAVSLEAALDRLGRLEATRTEEKQRLKAVETRIAELEEYGSALEKELERLGRAASAATTLAELRVTHCPACDQRIHRSISFESGCYLCGQTVPERGTSLGSGTARVKLEMERVESELGEVRELLSSAKQERRAVAQGLVGITDQMDDARATIRPLRSRMSQVLSSRVSEIQVALGREEERRLQWRRIRRSMERRQHILDDIAGLESEIGELQQAVEATQASIDYDSPAETLAAGMNMYLNALNEVRPNAWTQRSIRVQLTDRRVLFLVGERSWKKQLGGTLRLYFLLAYHYGLLHLSADATSNHPGWLILDFPPELDDGSRTKDKENFVLEPFVDLLAQDEYKGCQVIAAGNAFEGLKGAHRVELSHVWR